MQSKKIKNLILINVAFFKLSNNDPSFAAYQKTFDSLHIVYFFKFFLEEMPVDHSISTPPKTLHGIPSSVKNNASIKIMNGLCIENEKRYIQKLS